MDWIDNLFEKIGINKFHGYLRELDTKSIESNKLKKKISGIKNAKNKLYISMAREEFKSLRRYPEVESGISAAEKRGVEIKVFSPPNGDTFIITDDTLILFELYRIGLSLFNRGVIVTKNKDDLHNANYVLKNADPYYTANLN